MRLPRIVRMSFAHRRRYSGFPLDDRRLRVGEAWLATGDAERARLRATAAAVQAAIVGG